MIVVGIILLILAGVIFTNVSIKLQFLDCVWRKNRESVDISWGFWKNKKVRVQRLSMMRIMITIRWK